MHYHCAKNLLLICFESVCKMLEMGVVKICCDDYIVTFYGQVAASVEVLMINHKLCFTLLSMTGWFCCSEGKVHPITCHEGTEGEYKYSSTLSLTSVLDGGGWLAPCPSCFGFRNDPVPIVEEAGWAPGLVLMGVKNLTPARI
jgi:hypothetical protein